MISIDLSGKVILITGAMGAIAEYMVKRLVAAGATLVLTDLKSEDEAREMLDEWQIPHSSYFYFSADITDSAQVDRVIQAAFETFPKMDTVIGHAGGCGLHPFATTSEADYERIFRFNYFAQTYLARSTLSYWMQNKIIGHLIFTSSYVARMPHTLIPAYSSAKAALENFARSLALEYALTGIRVNVVSPGNVAAGSSLKVFDEDPAYREFVLRVSLGRRNSPESIADAFVFLCSPLAAEINGQVLSPDYGAGIGNRL
ncbi:MAG TPA: SDR family oxidoreductase [Candidatus Sulfotelmatobacter sp.]|jgi:NAD(P)-dependent dehydrogenase (short-subunit alcohol dehydrogenase family)